MTSPLSSAGAIVGAALIAQKAVRQIGQAIGFDEVLKGSTAEPAGVTNVDSTIGSLTEAIRDRILGLGIDPNFVGSLTVQAGGQIEVSDEHPRAAEIEASLSADPKVKQIVGELRNAGEIAGSSADSGPWSIDLTNGQTQENIRRLLGG